MISDAIDVDAQVQPAHLDRPLRRAVESAKLLRESLQEYRVQRDGIRGCDGLSGKTQILSQLKIKTLAFN